MFIPVNSRILVSNIARFGDTLLATPLARALAAAVPDGSVDYLAHHRRAEVLQGLQFINRVIPVRGSNLRWRRYFSGGGWDYAFILDNDERVLRYALRQATKVVAFRQENAEINQKLWKIVEQPQGFLHAVDHRMMLGGAVGIFHDGRGLSYQVSSDEASQSQRWLGSHGFLGRTLVGLQVASFPSKAYRDWPVEQFLQLAEQLSATRDNIGFVLLGDNDARERTNFLAEKLGHRAINAAGLFTMRESAALMQQLHLYIGVDTGPTHIAGALQLPMVALYHCFHRGEYLKPLQHPMLRVIEHPVTDDECFRERDIAEIPVDTVVQAANELLAQMLV